MRPGTLVLSRPDRLVVLEPQHPELARRIDRLVREHGAGPYSPLQAGALVRKLGDLAPLRCGCGCGRTVPAGEAASIFEAGAVLS